MTAKEMEEFVAYLRSCTDKQIQGVYDKETKADRNEYAMLAVLEADRRGILLKR